VLPGEYGSVLVGSR